MFFLSAKNSAKNYARISILIFAGISFRSFSGIYLPDFCFTGISIWTRASSILSITFSLIITS